ncbi:MAG: protein kinase family protein [Rhabdochlamydiaceae bacterium]
MVALGALSAFAPWLPVALAVAFIALVVIGKYAPRSITHKPNPKINMDNFQKLAGRFLYLSECVDILNYLNTHKDELTAQAKNENRCIRVKAHGNPDLRRTLLFTPDGKVFIILNKINKGDKVIGKGAAKVVKYCFELTEQKMCTHATFKDKTMFDKEIILLEKLKGKPNILPLLATDEFMSKDGNLKYSMITEYCDCGDLLSVLEEPDNLPIEQPRDFCRQLAQALKAVHNEGYSHNDIKIENIFVKKEENGAMTPFLADFGLAYEISSDNQKKIDGTWLYLHPHTIRALLDPHAKEILSSQTSRDIWALGAVIYSVAFPNKVVPWMENIPKNVRFGSEEEKRIIFANLEKLSISKKPAFDKPTDETSLEYLAWNMLQADPSKQFNIDQVVNFLTD